MKKLIRQSAKILMLFISLIVMMMNSVFAQNSKLPLGVSPDYIFALTNDTNFQVMGIHADGSVLCFHFKTNSKLVDKVAFRKTDTSDVFLLLFDSTGYPSVGSCKHQIYLFGNYHNQKADIVIMNTDGSVKEFKGSDAVFPQPLLDIIQKKTKSSGPAPGMFDLDSLTFSDAIGYAATGVGIVACVATLGGGGAWALPCGAAIIDVASKVIPDEYKESKLMLEYASAVFTMKGLVKNGALKAMEKGDDILDKWQLTLEGVSKASEVVEGWLNEPEQKNKIDKIVLKCYTDPHVIYGPKQLTSKPDINTDDYNTIIGLYNEGEAKLKDLEKKKSELWAGLNQTNFNEINAKVTIINKQYDSTRTAHESKMKAIASKRTIKFGFIKEDNLPYLIKEVVLYDVSWNGPLNLLVMIYFDAQSYNEETIDLNTGNSKVIVKVMREMGFDILDQNNQKIKSSMVIINKTFRDQRFVSTAFSIKEFEQMKTLKFNTKEYGVEY